MRKLFSIIALTAAGLGLVDPVAADTTWPGRIIIGYGGSGGSGGTTGEEMVAGGCVLPEPIECECFPEVPVLHACKMSAVDTGCLMPDTPYLTIEQPDLVVAGGIPFVLGNVKCTGLSDASAYIVLPPAKP